MIEAGRPPVGSAPSAWRAWLGLAALGALIAASLGLERHRTPLWVMAALWAGLLLWVVLASASEGRKELPPLDPEAGRPRRGALLAALAAAGLSFWRMPTDEFRLLPTLLWFAAIALWVAAWRPAGPSPPQAARAPWSRAEAIGLTVVLAVAVFFCFWRLQSVPPNPVSDHCEEMLDMLDLLHGRHAIYFLRNLGREPLHFYWSCAFVFAGLPLHFLTLKVGTAVLGVAGVLALYFLGREFGGPVLGLSVAALAAWGKWNFSLARQGLDYTHAILPTTILLWALSRWQRRGDRGSLLAAGAAAGAGLFGYTSFRVAPLLVPLAFAFALTDRRRSGRRWRVVGQGLLVTATAVIVALPLLKFIFLSPNRAFFWARSATRATGAERALGAAPIKIFAGNLWNMAKAFHWQGSSTWTVMLENDPFVDIVTGGLLLAGCALVLVLIARGAWRWVWLPPALVLLTLPSTLSLAYPNENPSLNRAGPAVPVVFLIAGAALAWLARGFRRAAGPTRAVGLAALAALSAWSATSNYRRYFIDFSDSYQHLIEHSMEMAQALRDEHARGIPYANMYLLGVDYWVDGRNIAFQIDDPAWADDHLMPQGKLPERLTARPLVFLYKPEDVARLHRLRGMYPGEGRVIPQTYADRNFGVYVAR